MTDRTEERFRTGATITLPRRVVDAVLRECLALASTQDAADAAMVDLLHAVRDADARVRLMSIAKPPPGIYVVTEGES